MFFQNNFNWWSYFCPIHYFLSHSITVQIVVQHLIWQFAMKMHFRIRFLFQVQSHRHAEFYSASSRINVNCHFIHHLVIQMTVNAMLAIVGVINPVFSMVVLGIWLGVFGADCCSCPIWYHHFSTSFTAFNIWNNYMKWNSHCILILFLVINENFNTSIFCSKVLQYPILWSAKYSSMCLPLTYANHS